jgi:hypothetical protein
MDRLSLEKLHELMLSLHDETRTGIWAVACFVETIYPAESYDIRP